MGDTAPAIYALLIGIDRYLPNRVTAYKGSQIVEGSYGSLKGCVRDVTLVEDFLRDRLRVPPERIFKLLARGSGGEPPEQLPTYENMVARLQVLAGMGQPGDQLYIHYSGHGGRVPTCIPQIKGPDGIDEALVPMNIGDSAARYLRDVELIKLIRALVDRQLLVTVVLDSCHSGGMSRGEGQSRGLDLVDSTPRPADSLVGSRDELLSLWRSETGGGTRNVVLGSGWLPEPQDYVLLAACRPSEEAWEFPFDGKESHGVLTYWLLDSLRDFHAGLTYKTIHDRILARVHSQYANQTPQLQGDGSRTFLGADHIPPVHAVAVLQVDGDKRVLLNAGQAHGIRKQASFAVYPPGTTDFTQIGRRQAIVTLASPKDIGAAQSWAAISTRLNDSPIEQGAQAVLLEPGSVQLIRKVRLVGETDAPSVDFTALRAALEGRGWVTVAGPEEPADFRVAVTPDGTYEVQDRAGVPIPNLRPALRHAEPAAAAALAARLVHVSRYQAIQQLANFDALSPLAGKLEARLTGYQDDYVPGEPPAPRPFTDPGNTPVVRPGWTVFLNIKNLSRTSLNITVLDLQAGWGIEQIYPSGPTDSFVELEAGKAVLLPLDTSLRPGYSRARDTIKILATRDTTSFRWLELPPLDRPALNRGATRGAPKGALEALCAALSEGQPGTREVTPVATSSQTWVSSDVELDIQAEGKP